MIDWQTLAIGLLSLGCGVFGWFLRILWEATERLKTDLNSLEVELPKTYVTKTDQAAMGAEIKGLLEEIKRDRRDDYNEIKAGLEKLWGAINGKADKS